VDANLEPELSAAAPAARFGNPFRPGAKVHYSLPTSTRVDLAVDPGGWRGLLAGADAVCHQASRVGLGVDFAVQVHSRYEDELTLDVAPELPTVLADEGQLRQALLNLLRNAREAMPKGGHIAVRVRGSGDGGVTLIVEDDGPGIDPALRQHLFEPFFTTKSHGTGLGLAITQQIAKAHGGTIDCESVTSEDGSAEPGGTARRARGSGTRFVLRLPGAKEASPRARSSPENAAE